MKKLTEENGEILIHLDGKLQNLISRNQGLPFRSRRSQMFFNVGVLKSGAIFAGKHLRWSHFSRKFQYFRPATLLKRNSKKGVFL